MAQLVEHRVHIAGVTGSSPVATTINPLKQYVFEGFFISSFPLCSRYFYVLIPEYDALSILCDIF